MVGGLLPPTVVGDILRVVGDIMTHCVVGDIVTPSVLGVILTPSVVGDILPVW